MANLNAANRIIQGLWIGSRLSSMEELSVRSFIAHGHDYHLYSYNPIENVPAGAVLRDANDIIPASRIFKYRDYDSYSGFSNHFRYKLLLDKGGWWADTDLICLRPFDFDADHVFSSQHAPEGQSPREVVNVGAIKCPRGSSLIRYAWDVCQNKDPAKLVWGEIGPLLLAQGVTDLGLEGYVQPAAAFCPVPWFSWKDIIDPAYRNDLGNSTYGVHLWNELWRRGGFSKDEEYDEACLYERLKAMYLERPAARTTVYQTRHLDTQVEHRSSVLPTVSALVLTKNSEARLARCLESIELAAFADEIVVCVDNASHDQTFLVAKRFTPHVHLVATDGYLESAIEKVSSFCSGNFILRIDDDETLGGNWDKSSFQLLAAFNHFAQVWLPRRWLVPPGESFIASNPWFPDLQLRLFANVPDKITWPKKPHEEMSVAGRPLVLFDRWINHYSFVDRPRGERRRRCEEYRQLNPEHDRSYVYLYEDLEFETLPCGTGSVAAAAPGNHAVHSGFGYALGSEIDFSIEGNGMDCVGKGWGLPENWGTWTVSEHADISFPLGKPMDSGATLTIEAMAFLGPQHPELRAALFYRNTLVGEWCMDRPGFATLSFDIGAELIARDCFPAFQFRISDPRSPSETGESADPRRLGLGFRSLRLERETGLDPAGGTTNSHPIRRAAGKREGFIVKAIRMGRRVLPNVELDVFWDEMWIFRVAGTFFPMPDVTEPEPWQWHELATTSARYLQQAEDNWYRVYRPNPGDVVVDIGAGRGEDTWAFSKAVGAPGRVVAIEAHPVSFSALKKFCHWNGLTNVTAINLACADKTARMRIETTSEWTANHLQEGEASATGVHVDAVPFDSIWEDCGLGRIDLLKMNIEGAERLALAGGRRALQHTRHIAVATHDHRANRGETEWFRTGDFVTSFLRDSGFHLISRDDSRSWARGHVHGIRPELQ